MTLLGNGTGARSRTRSSGVPGRVRSASSSRGRRRVKSTIRRVIATGGQASAPAPTRSVTSTTWPSLITPTLLSSYTASRIARLLRDSGGELRHDAAGEQLQRPEGLRVLDAVEADLHRGLDLTEELPLPLHLLDGVIRRPHVGEVVGDDRLRGEGGQRRHHLVVALV